MAGYSPPLYNAVRNTPSAGYTAPAGNVVSNPAERGPVKFSGNGFLSGTVSGPAPLLVTIRVHYRPTAGRPGDGDLVATTTASATGAKPRRILLIADIREFPV